MIKSFSDAPVIIGKPSIFLAGPTLTKEKQHLCPAGAWRKQALEILEKLGFDGVVYSPEFHTLKDYTGEGKKQFEWEWKALHNGSVILFWVPRQHPILPALCTNVEFGFYLNSDIPIVYGRPDETANNPYLDKMYYKVKHKKPHTDLLSTIKEAIKIANKAK